MEYEISDDPQGEPERLDGRRDGGLREGGAFRRAPMVSSQPGEPVATKPRKELLQADA